MILTVLLTIIYISYLVFEDIKNKKNRKKLLHVIHVNGTRGKSTVCRLIDSGLRAGGYKVVTKTTGTSPRIIGVDGVEKEIVRQANPSIKEQIGILDLAVRQKAEVLVVECMAVNPSLQDVSQNRILMADICIVTNVREDHIDIMGGKLECIAKSLGRVMPANGIFVTGDPSFYNYYKELGKEKNASVILAESGKDIPGVFGFPENVAIAMEVCKLLGVDSDVAINGMQNYKRDPGSLKIFKIVSYTNDTVYFVNAFAANDPSSTARIYEKINNISFLRTQCFVLLVNNRPDRAYRVEQLSMIIRDMKYDEIWLVGSYKKLMRNKLISKGVKKEAIKIHERINARDFAEIERDTTIFAIGNVAGKGNEIIDIVERIGELLVQ